MKVSIDWLKQFVDIDDMTIEELENLFSYKLCEVEEAYQLANSEGLTIGYVKECIEHPDSDHLHVCQVEVRPGEVSQIVCGAPNVRTGVKVIVANPGCVLPGDFKIKPSKIRGVESNGMLCSFQELGIPDKYIEEEFKNGIYLLDEDAPVGVNPLEYLKLNDFVFDLAITPNRADLLSMVGVAYDVASAIGKEVYQPTIKIKDSKRKNPVSVKIDTDKAYQYHARYIGNVKVGPSPWWLKQRLIAAGIRPINNVVDISNYVLMEYGQPLHTFDADKLGNNIVVRLAHEKEELLTLDNIKRELNENDIVITNGKEAVCLGGVMGGLSTEVDENTKNIILEAAEFDPISVRKTSSRIGLKSESSYRFERKIDSLRVTTALDRAAMLLQDLAYGEVYDGVSSVINREFKPLNIKVSLEKIDSYLGVNLNSEEINNILDNLDFEYQFDGQNYNVNIPSRRIDYDDNYQDLIEDIARMYGYDNIPLTIPKTSDAGALNNRQAFERKIKRTLSSLGLNEVINYSLVSKEKAYNFNYFGDEATKVLMPITEDREYMRLSLLPSLIDNVLYNKARKNNNLKFFEVSKVYGKDSERTLVSGILLDEYMNIGWQKSSLKVDFYLVKGILEELFRRNNIEVKYVAEEVNNLHPKKTAKIYSGDVCLGFIGELHPNIEHQNGLKNVFVFELDFDQLLALSSNKNNYHLFSKYPSIERDLAIVVNKEVLASDIANLIRHTAKSLLVSLELFDVYESENIGLENKQLAYKLKFADTNKTLETNDVDRIIKSIINRLGHDFNATLRN